MWIFPADSKRLKVQICFVYVCTCACKPFKWFKCPHISGEMNKLTVLAPIPFYCQTDMYVLGISFEMWTHPKIESHHSVNIQRNEVHSSTITLLRKAEHNCDEMCFAWNKVSQKCLWVDFGHSVKIFEISPANRFQSNVERSACNMFVKA